MSWEQQIQQGALQTQEFWTNLMENKQSKELLNITSAQIDETAFLNENQKNELKNRKPQLITAIKNESVTRYPVQVPESALTTFSDKYEEKISDSKRKREQRRPLSVLRRKKLNAEDVEKAESKYQDEKGRLLEAVVRNIEDSDNNIQEPDSKFLEGTTAADFMKRPDIPDLAAFLVNSRAQMDRNRDVLRGALNSEIFDESSGRECVRQFMELDLSADLRTDKALAKDADRLEKIAGKARAMINLADRHPEIKERLSSKEKYEFDAKLDRAFAFVDYYMVRKDIITDVWYRNHKNSEISARFEPMPQDLADQLQRERNPEPQTQVHAQEQTQENAQEQTQENAQEQTQENAQEQTQENAQEQTQENAQEQTQENAQEQTQVQAARVEQQNVYTPEQAHQMELQYYRQQNLTRKIWDAQICAETMNRYTSRTMVDVTLYQGLQDMNQKDEAKNVPSGWDKEWDTALRYSNPIHITPLPEIDEKTGLGEYFAKHNEASDAYYQAIRRSPNNIAGTKDSLKDFDRSYFMFANWPALESLSHNEFKRMMNCLTAFNEKVNNNTSPAVIANLRKKELKGLRLYKKVLLNELPSLQEKYGIGLLLENPLYFTNHHERDIRKDVGNEQTISSALDVFKKYGILDVNDPADQDLFLTMNYIYASHTAAITARNTLAATIQRNKEKKTYPSYADLMRQYEICYHTTLSGLIPASDLLRIHELEKKLENHPRIMWEKKLHYTAPAS